MTELAFQREKNRKVLATQQFESGFTARLALTGGIGSNETLM